MACEMSYLTLRKLVLDAGVAKPGNAHALRACGPLGPGSSNLPPGATDFGDPANSLHLFTSGARVFPER